MIHDKVLNPTLNHYKHYQYFITLTQNPIIVSGRPSHLSLNLSFSIVFVVDLQFTRKRQENVIIESIFLLADFVSKHTLHLNSNYCLMCNLSNYSN